MADVNLLSTGAVLRAGPLCQYDWDLFPNFCRGLGREWLASPVVRTPHAGRGSSRLSKAVPRPASLARASGEDSGRQPRPPHSTGFVTRQTGPFSPYLCSSDSGFWL